MCLEDTGIDPEFSCIFVHYILVKYVAFFKMFGLFFRHFPPASKICELFPPCSSPEAEFLDEILTKVLKVLRVFLPVTSTALP